MTWPSAYFNIPPVVVVVVGTIFFCGLVFTCRVTKNLREREVLHLTSTTKRKTRINERWWSSGCLSSTSFSIHQKKKKQLKNKYMYIRHKSKTKKKTKKETNNIHNKIDQDHYKSFDDVLRLLVVWWLRTPSSSAL